MNIQVEIPMILICHAKQVLFLQISVIYLFRVLKSGIYLPYWQSEKTGNAILKWQIHWKRIQ